MKPFALLKRWLWFACAAVVPLALGAQQPVRPAITGIAFARFYTTDLPAAKSFYGGLLGLQAEAANGLTLYPVNHAQWIELVSDQPPPSPVLRMAAVGFTTRDAAALERYLYARGVALESPLRQGEFSVRDPEGNVVFFVQRDANAAVAHAAVSPRAVSGRMIHVGFVVHDEAKEDAFWRDILGFRPYWHGGASDTRDDWVMQQVPEGTDYLEYMLNTSATPTLKQNGGTDHVSLGVEHMSDLVAALARNGCEGAKCTNTHSGRDGKIQLGLFDPDSTRVEVMEFTPANQPCCSTYTGPHPSAEESR